MRDFHRVSKSLLQSSTLTFFLHKVNIRKEGRRNNSNYEVLKTFVNLITSHEKRNNLQHKIIRSITHIHLIHI